MYHIHIHIYPYHSYSYIFVSFIIFIHIMFNPWSYLYHNILILIIFVSYLYHNILILIIFLSYSYSYHSYSYLYYIHRVYAYQLSLGISRIKLSQFYHFKHKLIIDAANLRLGNSISFPIHATIHPSFYSSKYTLIHSFTNPFVSYIHSVDD